MIDTQPVTPMISEAAEEFSPLWPTLFLLAGLLLLTLIPYAQAGFFCDDAINSTFPGTMLLNGQTLWQNIAANNRHWIDSGRLYPLAQVGTFLNWAYLSYLPYERAGQIGLILLNMVLFARLLSRITGSRAVGWIFLAVLPTFFQARTWADPMLDFSPLLQQVMFFLVLSVDCFAAALDSGRATWRLPLAWVFFVAAMLTYEIGLSTAVAAAMLAMFGWKRARGIALWGFGGYCVLALAYIAANLYLKAHAVALYAGVAMSFNWSAVKAYGIQAGAVLPFTYYVADPHQFLRHASWPRLDTLGIALVILILTLLVFWQVCRSLRPMRYRGGLAMAVCVALTLVPALFVAISTQYQSLVSWGLAYLPIYLQFFGFAGLIVVLLCEPLAKVGRRTRAAGTVLLGLLVGCGNAGAFLVNGLMVEHENTYWLYPRVVDEQAAHEGLFDQVPEGSTIVRDTLNAWDIPAFYAQNAHRRFETAPLKKLLSSEPDTAFGRLDVSAGSYYELRSAATLWNHGGGWALLSHLQSLDFRKAGKEITILDRRLQNPLYFHLESGMPSMRHIDLNGSGLVALGGLAAVPWRADRMKQGVRGDVKWSLFQLPEGQYLAGAARPVVDDAFPLSVQRPFLLQTLQPDSTLSAGKLEATTVDSPMLPASRVAGIGYGCEFSNGGVLFGTESFSRLELSCPGQSHGLGLAFRVRPSAEQLPDATIVGNHRPDVRGFSLERVPGGTPETYEFVVGDGKNWQTMGTIQLASDRWNLVVLNLSPEGSELYVTGEAKQHCGGAVVPVRVDDDSVWFGNWMAGNRAFQGTIKDFVRLLRPFTLDEIQALLADEPMATPSIPTNGAPSSQMPSPKP